MQTDAIVVGCGLTGGIIARHLADKGMRIHILERRNHIAGNIYDYYDSNGILVQKYGPHVFHTKSKKLYETICKYSPWYEYHVKCRVNLCGKETPSPFNFQTIDDFFSQRDAYLIKSHLRASFPGIKSVPITKLMQSSDDIIREYAYFLFSEDYAPYTAKQWGIAPSEIDISVLNRVPIRLSYEDGYFDDTYQIMPENGFTSFFQKIVSHPNIQIQLNTDARQMISIEGEKLNIEGIPAQIPVIYTGAVDELLDLKYGALPYRSLRFDFKTEYMRSYQEVPIVAYPKAGGYTRITEYTKMPLQKASGITVISLEYPQVYQIGKTEPYYPILTQDSQTRYKKYCDDLSRVKFLYICGRLGDYQYYNMDCALERALELCEILDDRLGG